MKGGQIFFYYFEENPKELDCLDTFGLECSGKLPNPGSEGVLVLVVLLFTFSLKYRKR